MRYAVIDGDGLVVNTIVWDGESEWSPPEGHQVVGLSTDSFVGIGATYQSDGTFITNQTPIVVPTPPVGIDTSV